VDALDTVSWLVALEGLDPGRVLRIGERRALNADGWFESDPETDREIFVWIEDGVVLIEDGVGPDDELDDSKRALDAEGRALGTDRAEPLLCGDELTYGVWRWRVVEMPPGCDPDPEEVKLQPRREALGGEVGWAPADDVSESSWGEIGLDVTQPEPFARPTPGDTEGTPLEGRSPFLIALSGARAGEFFALDTSLTFGRAADADVQIHHQVLNRLHVRVERERGVAMVCHTGGQHSAFLNGVEVASGPGRWALEDNDLIMLASGVDVFLFKVLREGDWPTKEQIAAWVTRYALEQSEQQRLTRGGRTRER
jgi:hypothetical protein